MSSLIVVSGRSRGFYFPLEPRNLVLGRDEACDIQVLDELVSRRHLVLRWDEGAQRHTISDLDSVNGVFVNGRRIVDTTVLLDHDRIEIGTSCLLFTVKDFFDRDGALNWFKQRGQHARSTIFAIRPQATPSEPAQERRRRA